MDESNVLGGWEEAADAENAAIDAVTHRVRRGATTIETALSTAEHGASASGKLIRTLTSTPPLAVVPHPQLFDPKRRTTPLLCPGPAVATARG